MSAITTRIATAAAQILGPRHQANTVLLNATAQAYSCMLDLSELGLQLTGRIELDADMPVVWIDPPADPFALWGRWARINNDYNRTPRRYAVVIYRDCRVCWAITEEAA